MEIMAIAFGALVIGVVLGGVLSRVVSPRAAMFAGLLLLGLAGVLLLGRQAFGLGDIGTSIVSLLFLLPAGGGSTLVGLVAHRASRR